MDSQPLVTPIVQTTAKTIITDAIMLKRLVSRRCYYSKKYKDTGDEQYKHRCDELTDSINNLRKTLGRIPQQYNPDIHYKGRPTKVKDIS